MTRTWQDVKKMLDTECDAIRFEPPPEIVAIFKHRNIESGAGTHGQCMSAWVFIAGDTRYLAFYGVTNVVALATHPAMTLEALRATARQMMPLSAEFLGYCGLKRLWSLVREVDAVLDQVQTKDEFVELMSALATYVSTVSLWVQHYFPWNLGELFPHQSREDIAELLDFHSAHS